MSKWVVKSSMVILAAFVCGVVWLGPWDGATDVDKQVNRLSIGNPDTLQVAYTRWKARQAYLGEDNTLRLSLQYTKGLSTEFTRAHGTATFDLSTGSLVVDVIGLPNSQDYAVWLVDTRTGKTPFPKYVGGMIRGEELQGQEGKGHMEVFLKAEDFWGFELDRLVVTRSGENPQDSIVLSGSSSLFQRRYFNGHRGGAIIAKSGDVNHISATQPGTFSFLVPAPAYAQQGGDPDLEALIAQGEDLFFNETFDGNGRTCGTCHRAENNFTIDPDFIATLPGDDPLFVAEFNEDLAQLENPTLMRQFGLILVNVDGLEDPTQKFVMRSVPHMLGMSMSIQANATEAPLEMTGWSGDGAPGNGTLREFAIGAVIQHFPKTLNREPGEDFRLPTDEELDAIEAFMLSLGRQQDLDLQTLRLTDEKAEQGRVLFITEDSQNQQVEAAKCTLCHSNAGALTANGINRNFDTGVENALHPADLTGEFRPRDGGFGTQSNASTGGFGDGSFNSTSLVEAADTAPYFHNNLSATLEDAIAFYDSNAFRSSPEGQLLQALDTGGQELAIEVDSLAAFLRVINVLDNIQSVAIFMERAKGATATGAQKLLALAQADLDDALAVLADGELHEEAVGHLENSKALTTSAIATLIASDRDGLIDQAISEAQAGRDLMVDTTPVSDTTNPTVTIISPAAGNGLSGMVTISVDASDNEGIDQVSFAIGQTQIGMDLSAPFTQSWDTTTFSDGANQVTATAVDLSGNSQVATITVTVSNAPPPDTTPPTVTIISPIQGSTVSGTVTISANASDDDGVDKVIFTIGQTVIGQALTAPFAQAWDTTAFPDGTNLVTATAVDLSGNSRVASITVTVNNAPPPPPICGFYGCSNPSPPPAAPPPPPPSDPTPPPPSDPGTTPPPSTSSGNSPDGEVEGTVAGKDLAASTITISSEDGNVTLVVTTATVFKGSVSMNLSQVVVGHVVQAKFFQGVNEAVQIETDFPEGF